MTKHKRLYLKTYYQKNKEKYRDHYNKNKKRFDLLRRERKEKIKLWLKEYKSNLKCEICGESHPATLDFH
ncbi:MAG: hypothetical protein ACREGC_04315, partial [Minisyncoccia bacterium]